MQRWSIVWLFLLLAAAFVPAQAGSAAVRAESLNLGFEQTVGDLPLGWTRAAEGRFHVALDTAVARTGAHSVRIESVPGGRYGAISRRLDAGPLVGKRVRLRGSVRTEGVTGWVALWVRVDGGQSTYVMSDGPLGTSPEWSEVVADAVIAPGTDLTFGAALVGEGRAWFDDLSFEVVEPAVEIPIRFTGRVVDPRGVPVAGADVALIDASGIVERHLRSARDGRFVLQATAGSWALSAHAPGRSDLVGAFLDVRDYAADAETTLVLTAAGGVTVRCRARGVAEGATARIAAQSDHTGDVWVARFGKGGTLTARLPHAERFAVTMLTGGVGGGSARREGDVARGVLEVVVDRPVPAAVTQWIARNAVPLASTDPEAPVDDIAALRPLIGAARVVALGEGTHGTREFMRLKHRIFRGLLADGFTVFALEIGQAEAREINDYVVHGLGDARSALGSAGMWVWETEEVLDLIEWMRRWNADPAHEPKLQFVGFDVQSSNAAYEAVHRYVTQVAPEDTSTLLAGLDVLQHVAGREAFAALTKPRQAEVIAAVAALENRFDASRSLWAAATSEAAFATARQDARNLAQATEQFASAPMSAAGSQLRDQAMAENILWLHRQLPPGARMVVSAHNLHVADLPGRMGRPLRAALGRDWLAIGLEFGEGTFQAKRARTDGARSNIEAITLPPPSSGQVGAALLASGPDVYALDLRALPARSAAADWFRSPQLVREVGYVFRSEPAMTGPQVLPERFDALLFVAHTTPARQLPIDASRMP